MLITYIKKKSQYTQSEKTNSITSSEIITLCIGLLSRGERVQQILSAVAYYLTKHCLRLLIHTTKLNHFGFLHQSDQLVHQASHSLLQVYSQFGCKLRDSYIFIILSSYRIKISFQRLLESLLIVLLISPSLTEHNTNLPEIKGGDDNVKGKERIATQFMSLHIGCQMLLQFGSLERQLEKVVTPLYVGSFIHEENEQIGSDMYKFVSGDLKFYLIYAIGIINFDDFLLRLILIFSKCVAFLFVPTNTAHI